MTDIQIQPGHYYRANGGGLVGPMQRSTLTEYPWQTPSGDTYLDDGRYDDGRYSLEDYPSQPDLVEDLGTTNPHVIG